MQNKQQLGGIPQGHVSSSWAAAASVICMVTANTYGYSRSLLTIASVYVLFMHP